MKGQQFTVFKFLIGVIMAIALLSIVYFVVAGFPKAPVSGFESTKDVIKGALSTPSQCLGREMVTFERGETITMAAFTNTFPAVTFTCRSTGQGVLLGLGVSSCLLDAQDTVTFPISATCSISPIRCDLYFGADNCVVT